MIANLPKTQGLTLVLVGDFNPKIFHPSWFSCQGLIKKSEEESAEIEIIRPEISIFQLEWMKLSITRDRASFETTQEPYYEILRDLVISTFRLLSHTPIKMLGINVKKTFSVEQVVEWHNYGHTLAPKEPWQDLLVEPGLFSITMQGKRPDNFEGYVHVVTGPTPEDILKQGISIFINDHYIASSSETDPIIGSDQIMDILESSWSTSIRRSNTIIENLLRIKK